jgi:rsbT co-antagonist protein RsbR
VGKDKDKDQAVSKEQGALGAVLAGGEERILSGWLAELPASERAALRAQAQQLLGALGEGVRSGGDTERLEQQAWASMRAVLETISASRAAQGASAGETSHFVLSLKKPLFDGLQERLAADPKAMFAATWAVSVLVDRMAQWTASVYQRSREEVIRRQQLELLELSTPVVRLWDGVLAVPMIGTLDSSRTQMVMESLLQRIVETGSQIAIVDITGVPTVDTLVAQHLLKTVAAIRLMGADCIISGIRPQIAQTIVHLGIDLQGVTTKATLADALALAMGKLGYAFTRGSS